MIDSAAAGVDPARKARLIKVLDIDPSWRMHQVRGLAVRPDWLPLWIGRWVVVVVCSWRVVGAVGVCVRVVCCAVWRRACSDTSVSHQHPPGLAPPLHQHQRRRHHHHPATTQVSDGQRRRVQICVGLLRPFKVLLLDEITVDLDVLGRADLMAFLAEECALRGATVVYATHIFDGLEAWPTHVAYVARGRLQFLEAAAALPHLARGRLLEMVAALLREERELLRKAGLVRSVEYDPAREGAVGAFSYAFNNGWVPGTLASSLANSSNAVMRC